MLLDRRSLDNVETSHWANCLDKISLFLVIREPYILKKVKLRNDDKFNRNLKIFDMQIPHWGFFSTKLPTTIHRSPKADNRQWEFVLMLDYTRNFQSEKRNYKVYYFLII